ncbi:MAG TPA: FtsQ-type POTRA domain-containing protein [Candidatus Cloacimonadota bacterium]|nr:FtsQ-type POTRA domain-containing protein [Candidatus Cloacimonadales bacterium]HPY95736.1 FtsQ-type POTRA domain-containing protein [Candidatus Cloacimonadota bacterium]HQB40266.1 FtsQ-type POTRA domain-containing protein [Candidatus Cloacimonadota bacterium]
MNRRYRRKRGSTRFIVFFILITVFVIGIWHLIVFFIKDMDAFNIKKIEIVGQKNLDPVFLENLSAEFIGKNTFQVKKQDFIRKYENIVRVKSVVVSRRLPSTVRIEIHERLGVLYVKTPEGDFFPVDENFIVLDKADFYPAEDIPFANINIQNTSIQIGKAIENRSLEQILQLHNNIKKKDINMVNNISEYYFKGKDIAFIDSHKGCRVIIGDTDINKRLERYIFLRDNQSFQKNITIDLRFKDQAVIRE